MPGSGTSNSQSQTQQQQNYNSQTDPWQRSIPSLESLLGGINTQMPGYQTNGTEQQALQQLTQNSQNLPNFAPQATSLVGKYLSGDPTGLLTPALGAYQNQLNPIANQNNDPTKTPGMQNLLDTIRADISNQINGQFAGAGRDLSGLNQQTLARGIAQGEAAPLLNQYNQNVAAQTGAAGNLFNAAGQTAGAMTGNQGQAFNIANLIPGLQNAGPMGVLSAQSMARGLPLNNLGMLENLTVPIAGLGGNTQGQSKMNSFTQGSYTMSPIQQIATLFGGGGNSPMTGMTGAAQGGANALGGLLKMFAA